MRPGLAAELEFIPGGLNQAAHGIFRGENALGVNVLALENKSAGLGDEADNGAVFHGDQRRSLGHDDLAPRGNNIVVAFGVFAASVVRALGLGGKKTCRGGNAFRRHVKIFPLIGEASAQCAGKCLNKSHDVLLFSSLRFIP